MTADVISTWERLPFLSVPSATNSCAGCEPPHSLASLRLITFRFAEYWGGKFVKSPCKLFASPLISISICGGSLSCPELLIHIWRRPNIAGVPVHPAGG